MAEEWFFSRAGQEYGPCGSQDLKKMAQSGQLTASDLVWKEGMKEWVPASTVKGLFAGAAAAASSASTSAPQPAAAASPAAAPLDAAQNAVDEGASPFAVQQTMAAQNSHSDTVQHANIPEKFRSFLNPSESVVYASNPSRAARVISMIMAGVGGFMMGLPALAGGALVLIVWLFTIPISAYIAHLRWKHQYYIITNRRTIVSQGIFNVSVSILPNQNITMISVNTGIIDRWLGLNTIELSSAGSGGGLGVFGLIPGLNPGNVTLRWVANAPQVVSLIRV